MLEVKTILKKIWTSVSRCGNYIININDAEKADFFPQITLSYMHKMLDDIFAFYRSYAILCSFLAQ